MEEEETRRQGVPLGRRFMHSMTTNNGKVNEKYEKYRPDC